MKELVLAILLLGAGRNLAHAGDADEDAPVRLGDRVTLRAGSITPDFTLDGKLSERAWQADDDSIADLVTVEPKEGAVPEGRTIVKVLADPHTLVIGVRCYDHEPDRIVSFSKAQDSVLDEEDHVLIVFDSFLDGRSGSVFAVNPTGARFDGLITSRGEEVNTDWDASWEAKTSRDELGWCAEIRIPVTSIPFKKDLPGWGFNVQRRVQRLQETSRWSGANVDYEIYQTSHAGLLTHLPEFDLGLGLAVRPAFVGRATTSGPGKKTVVTGEPSLDATERLGTGLLSAWTVNTDVSETEVDVRRINLTRFPISFPEKRTFFVGGSDIFEFGLGLDEETLLPFFSRRIGLVGPDEDDLAPVPINAGAKVSGRVGGANLGALVVNTRKTDDLPITDGGATLDVPGATMGAVRIKQDILDESAVGVLATFGDQLNRSASWSAGLDFTYQTSSFREDKNLLVGLWGLRDDRESLRGDKSAYGFSVDYPNDLWDINLTSMRIGDGFDPSLGFVPRRGVQIVSADAQFAPRPTWPLVRQMFHEASFNQFVNLRTHRWESYTVTIKPLDWVLESGDRFDVTLEPQGDRPPREFEVSPDVDIAPGSYEWTRRSVGVHSAEKRRISAELRWEDGGFYTGQLRTFEARLALKPSALLTAEFTGERNRGRVMAPENESVQLFDKHFTQDLMGIRLELNVSPDLQVSSLTQYDTESRELGSNSRLRWTFDPHGDLFVVYNHNLRRKLDNRWRFVSNQVPMKIQYAWQF